MCYFYRALEIFRDYSAFVPFRHSDFGYFVVLTYYFEFRFCEHSEDTQLESKRHNFMWTKPVSRFFGTLTTSHTFYGIEGFGVCLRVCVCSDFFPYISPICLMRPDFRLGLGHGFENFRFFGLHLLCVALFLYIFIWFLAFEPNISEKNQC
jgi:hypothetical protein